MRDDEVLLTDILDQQAELMVMLGIPMPYPMPDLLTNPVFKDALVMLISEVVECLNPITVATKPWKQGHNPDELRAQVLDEVVDLWFFVAEISILAGLGAGEIFDRYMAKYEHIVEKRLRVDDTAKVPKTGLKPEAHSAKP